MDKAKPLDKPHVANALQMPCLGRPFQLGMLYDCRDERLIPGVTLWDHSTLQKALDSMAHEGVEFSIIAEDKMENKTSSLGVEAGLKLSLLGGLVNISGSAKFLDDQATSKQQARISLKYSMTSHFEQLTMQHLAVDKVQYPDVFNKGDATHVVTAVLYGAEAFFVFDRQLSKNEKQRDIHGRMAVMIKKLPSVTIEGDGQLDMKDAEKGEVDKFQCQFHGDILLPENPTTFQEAVKIYKELPRLICGDSKSTKVVAKSVWLYPLCKLDSRAAKLVREISTGLVSQMQTLIEELRDLKVRANDLKKSDVYTNFPGIQKQLSHFTDMLSEYETDVAKKVSIILPQIRGGGEEETKLAEVFKQNYASPFNQHSLSSWLQGKQQEEKMLQTYLTGLQCDEIQFAFSTGELDAIVTDLDIDHVLCFAFKVAGSNNPYLEVMFNYLRTSETSQEYKQATPKHWYQDRKIANDIKTKAKVFRQFAQVNGSSGGTKFVVTDISEEEEDNPDQGADILLYSGGLRNSYQTPGQPGKPTAPSATHDTIELKWSKPEYGAQNVESYTILYRQEGDQPDQWKEHSCCNESTTLKDLEANTKYYFRVRAVCEVGVSLDSEVSDPINTEMSPHNRLAVLLKSVSERIEHDTKGLEIYKLPLTLLAEQKKKGIAKYCIDDPRSLSPDLPEKVVMCVGATGSGKSTLINGIANYILGVSFKDGFRFKLICDEGSESQAHSQTQLITSYSFPRFEGSPLPYQLTVIDTPGFGDTRGMERDEEITTQIKEFFTTKGILGIDHLDGIGFVSKSPDGRLTPTQKYIIDSILAVFGKDIANNIFVMATFADGAYPPVMGAITTHIKDSRPPIPIDASKLQFFKFNNSALYTKPHQATNFDVTYWDVGYSSFRDFFHHLGIAKPQTLSLTRDVLKERQTLQALVQGIQEDIHKSMDSIDEMRQEKQALEANEAKIKANQNFTYVATEHHTAKETLKSGVYVTNCLKCNRTCHYPCYLPPDESKEGCAVMDRRGHCQICDGHCSWNVHTNNDFRYVDQVKKVTKHFADLEKKYKAAKEGKATAEGMISKIKQKVTITFDNICKNISKAQRCIERLEKIALKPDPLTEMQYIELMIKSEKNTRKIGWEQRVQCYEKAKKAAEIMAKARQGELPSAVRDALTDDLLKDIPLQQQEPKSLGWRSYLPWN